MNMQVATTDAEIAACFPAMQALRPHLTERDFIDRVRRQARTGYRLAFVTDSGAVVAVAGFRLSENLAWGRFLYVDDLVTSPEHRSRGHGSRLLAWLKAYGVEAGCSQLHLDSGAQRLDAHRFYRREGLTDSSLHFFTPLTSD